jgi:uncharacterized protein YdeI (BOF family)
MRIHAVFSLALTDFTPGRHDRQPQPNPSRKERSMKSLITALAFLVAGIASTVSAESIFPHPAATAASIAALLAEHADYERLTVTGYIVRRVEKDELFELCDNTGSILLKVDHKHWPYPVEPDPHRRVQATGEFDFERSGASKLKVFDLRPAPQATTGQ